jgi:hypothetical protein
MHAIHRPKIIITIGKHFFPKYLIHHHSEKFYFLKFEGKAYEICLSCLRVSIKNYNPQIKISTGCHCMDGFNLALKS